MSGVREMLGAECVGVYVFVHLCVCVHLYLFFVCVVMCVYVSYLCNIHM